MSTSNAKLEWRHKYRMWNGFVARIHCSLRWVKMRSKLGLERLCNTCNCHSTKGSRRSSCFYDIFGFWIRQRFRDCCFFWGKRENYGKLGSYDVESVGSQPFLLVSRITYIYIYPTNTGSLDVHPQLTPRHWRSGTLSLVGLEAGGKLVKTWVAPWFPIWFPWVFGCQDWCWVDDYPVTYPWNYKFIGFWGGMVGRCISFSNGRLFQDQRNHLYQITISWVPGKKPNQLQPLEDWGGPSCKCMSGIV